jgi:hypothetical protein
MNVKKQTSNKQVINIDKQISKQLENENNNTGQ